jgi:hypothetical protein
MREPLDLQLRLSDIQWGFNHEKASIMASIQVVGKQLIQEGKMTQEQMDELLRRMEECKLTLDYDSIPQRNP